MQDRRNKGKEGKRDERRWVLSTDFKGRGARDELRRGCCCCVVIVQRWTPEGPLGMGRGDGFSVRSQSYTGGRSAESELREPRYNSNGDGMCDSSDVPGNATGGGGRCRFEIDSYRSQHRRAEGAMNAKRATKETESHSGQDAVAQCMCMAASIVRGSLRRKPRCLLERGT